ncbi:MAG: ABC transporter substrate-binding protein [Gammaproteobacteria bacterium]|nr:ABC transporter substrate-binding protein [Gammaproteobacteria bacterium]
MPYILKLCYLILSLFLLSCTQNPEPPLRIATNTFPGYEPLYLARSLGYYENTQINLVEMTSASEVIHALRNGTIEGAALTLDETLTLLADDIRLKIILVMDFSNGADVLLTKPEINSLAEIKGKQIAVEYSAVGALLLDAALASAKLSVTDIKVETCLYDNHINCYEENDAVITFEPVRTKLMLKGAKQLFDSSQIPGKIVDVLVVQDAVIKLNSQTIKNLLKGYFRARQYLEKKPEKASEQMALRQGISSHEVISSFNGIELPSLKANRDLLEGSNKLQATASSLMKYLFERELLRKKVDTSNIIDASFLPENSD